VHNKVTDFSTNLKPVCAFDRCASFNALNLKLVNKKFGLKIEKVALSYGAKCIMSVINRLTDGQNGL